MSYVTQDIVFKWLREKRNKTLASCKSTWAYWSTRTEIVMRNNVPCIKENFFLENRRRIPFYKKRGTVKRKKTLLRDDIRNRVFDVLFTDERIAAIEEELTKKQNALYQEYKEKKAKLIEDTALRVL